MKLFDSHCHLDDKSYDNEMNALIERADNAGVKKMMIVGVTKRSSEKAVELADSHAPLYASVGIHPHDAKECSEETLTALMGLAANPKVKAWGETGLDFNRMFSPREIQEKWLRRQIETADLLELPLIFHERDSAGRFLEILKEKHHDKRRGVVHCFSGNREEMVQYLNMGYYIGITGILTIKSRGRDLRELAPLIPADRILIETDAPYLTPAPEKNRIRRNEPAFVKSTLVRLAEVRGEKLEDLAETIWNNTCRLYDITG